MTLPLSLSCYRKQPFPTGKTQGLTLTILWERQQVPAYAFPVAKYYRKVFSLSRARHVRKRPLDKAYFPVYN